MKRFMKANLGVTLLEIMLVLAIAAMVIVMSVRYYQSAQSSSQANAFTSQVQAVTAAAENLAQGGVGYAALTQAGVQDAMAGGATVWNLPWGGAMTYTASATGFTLAAGTTPSTGVCALITAKFATMTRFTISATCDSVTYTAA